MTSTLILASQSPRRRALLAQLGLHPLIAPTHIDESRLPDEAPHALVQRLALAKAHACAQHHPHAAILAADTTVVLHHLILEKPTSPTHAFHMLQQLSNTSHTVLTAVALRSPARTDHLVVSTTVHFAPLDDDTIQRYVDSGEPMDKAGAYGIQGLGGAFVTHIHGSYTNVVGLPLFETLSLLRQHNVLTHFPLHTEEQP